MSFVLFSINLLSFMKLSRYLLYLIPMLSPISHTGNLSFSNTLKNYGHYVNLAVPDASIFKCFKQAFLLNMHSLFDRLVNQKEPTFQHIDTIKASTAMFDISDLEV